MEAGFLPWVSLSPARATIHTGGFAFNEDF